MRNRILLLLGLSILLYVSMTVNTLSYYSSVTSFGANVMVDISKIKPK